MCKRLSFLCIFLFALLGVTTLHAAASNNIFDVRTRFSQITLTPSSNLPAAQYNLQLNEFGLPSGRLNYRGYVFSPLGWGVRSGFFSGTRVLNTLLGSANNGVHIATEKCKTSSCPEGSTRNTFTSVQISDSTQESGVLTACLADDISCQSVTLDFHPYISWVENNEDGSQGTVFSAPISSDGTVDTSNIQSTALSRGVHTMQANTGLTYTYMTTITNDFFGPLLVCKLDGTTALPTDCVDAGRHGIADVAINPTTQRVFFITPILGSASSCAVTPDGGIIDGSCYPMGVPPDENFRYMLLQPNNGSSNSIFYGMPIGSRHITRCSVLSDSRVFSCFNMENTYREPARDINATFTKPALNFNGELMSIPLTRVDLTTEQVIDSQVLFCPDPSRMQDISTNTCTNAGKTFDKPIAALNVSVSDTSGTVDLMLVEPSPTYEGSSLIQCHLTISAESNIPVLSRFSLSDCVGVPGVAQEGRSSIVTY